MNENSCITLYVNKPNDFFNSISTRNDGLSAIMFKGTPHTSFVLAGGYSFNLYFRSKYGYGAMAW